MICKTCTKQYSEAEAIKITKVASNGIEHIQARCPFCNAYWGGIQQIGQFRFPFGKYKDKFVREINKSDPQYIDWLVNKSNMDDKFKERIKAEL